MSHSAAIILKSTGKVAPGVDGYGYALADALRILDRMAKKLKVRGPRSFLFEDPSIWEEFIDQKSQSKFAKSLAMQKEWHSCTDGIATFESLLSTLKIKGERKWQVLLVDEGVDSDDLRSDLMVCLKALQKAAKKNDQFHLDIG